MRKYKSAAIIAASIFAAPVQGCQDGGPLSESAEEQPLAATKRAVFAHDRLWMLNDNGSLSSLRPDARKPEPVSASGKLIDICKSSDRLAALVENGPREWSLQQYSPDRWTARATLPRDEGTLIGMDCDADSDAITLVTSKRLLEVEGNSVKAVDLSEELEPPMVNGSVLAASDTVWVGYNNGEWGGGLRRIDRRDGKLTVIENNRSGRLCGGPLNTNCDPVQGMVVSPWNASCVVVAIGLVHMMSHGRIVEVCGNNVRRLYFKPDDPQPPHGRLDDGEPASTVAFYGITRADKAIWAVGTDGLYRFTGPQAVEFRPLPEFQNRDVYSVNFEMPGIALVLTSINQQAALSGAAPIMVPR